VFLLPLLLKQAFTYSLWFREDHPQAHVWMREVVKRLEQDDAPFHWFTLFTETAALAHQRRQGMAKGLIEALDQTRACLQTLILPLYWGLARRQFFKGVQNRE
jgi:hypothetical protein